MLARDMCLNPMTRNRTECHLSESEVRKRRLATWVGMAMGWAGMGDYSPFPSPINSPPPILPYSHLRQKNFLIPVPSRDSIPNGALIGMFTHKVFFPLM